MKKLLCFVLVLVLALGGLGYAAGRLNAMENQITYEQQVVVGDPAVLSGKTAHIIHTGGDHLRWDTAYSFGSEPTYRTEFTLSQKKPVREFADWERMDLRAYQGGGRFSQGSSFSVSPRTPVGRMILACAEQVPSGQSLTQTVRAADYLEVYPLTMYLDYQSATLQSSVVAQSPYELVEELPDDPEMPDQIFFEEFQQAFRFPVQADSTYELTLTKNSRGELVEVELLPMEMPQIDFLYAVNDQGLYLLPRFEDLDGHGLEGDYPQGNGLYFLPWRVVGDYFTYGDDGVTMIEGHTVLPDLAAMKNIYPLPADGACIDFRPSPDGTVGWLLSKGAQTYRLTVLDLEHGRAMQEHDLSRVGSGPLGLQYLYRDGYLLALSDGQLVLVDLEGEGSRVLRTEAGEAEEYLRRLPHDPQELCLRYADSQLILLNPSYGMETSFWAAVYTPQGLAYLGRYQSSFYPLQFQGYHFSVHNFANPITLEG